MKKNRPSDVRNDALARAYKYARLGALGAARQWVRKAAAAAPLTPQQLYRLKGIFGRMTLDEILGDHGRELLIRGLERRLGGKP